MKNETQKAQRDNAVRIAVSIATHLLSLPSGGWPETQQAERDLADALPHGWTRKMAVDAALDAGATLHPMRRGEAQ